MTTTTTRPVEASAYREIAVRDIAEHPGNPREHFTDIDELAASILQVGLLEPLVVERLDVGFRLIAGARRLRAAKLVNIRTLPAIIRPPVTNPVDALGLMLIENGQRKTLDPIEEARGYARMRGLDPSLSQEDIARKVGKSQAHVSARLQLLNLTAGEQDAVRRGDLLLRDARPIARERAGTANVTQYTGWHLGKTHPLAEQARDRCRRYGHSPARRLGGAGCGECWERVIRDDEQTRLGAAAADRATPPPAPKSPIPGSVQREEGVDEAAIVRALAGERMQLTIPEREEAVRRLCGRGLSDGSIGDRLDMAARTVLRIRQRLGIPANVDDAGEPSWRTG